MKIIGSPLPSIVRETGMDENYTIRWDRKPAVLSASSFQELRRGSSGSRDIFARLAHLKLVGPVREGDPAMPENSVREEKPKWQLRAVAIGCAREQFRPLFVPFGTTMWTFSWVNMQSTLWERFI